jgi:tRNA (guanine26-N2/guanine27-N2)-dimethyltransferase
MKEGNIIVPLPEHQGDVCKSMDVFYNPVMKHHRDVSVAVVKKVKPVRIGLPLSGSGIRAVRIMKECGYAPEVYVNDKRSNFMDVVHHLFSVNDCDLPIIHNMDANVFMQSVKHFDYLDLDPFGTPAPFIQAAISSMRNGAILAITATDTAALTGTYPTVARRKYWAKNIRTNHMHELGIRILIRYCQLQGASLERALTPIMSYSKDHYYRIFFRVKYGKKAVDKLLDQHHYAQYHNHQLTVSRYNYGEGQFLGPLYTGLLQDKEFLQSLDNEWAKKLLSENDVFGGVDVYAVCSSLHRNVPPFKNLLKMGGTQTHFSERVIKGNVEYVLRELTHS